MYEKTYKSNVLKQNPKTKVRKTGWAYWKKFVFILFGIGVLIGFGYMLRYSKMQINVVNVSGTSVIDEQEIINKVNNQLTGKWLWFFPRTSVLLVNDKKIERNLKKDFPRIETISAKRTNLHTLEVNIKEFGAKYLWCIPSNEEDDCYFMDKNGIVYSNAPVFSGTAYPKIFTGAPLMDLPFLGIRTEDLQRVVEFQEKLLEIYITPATFKYVSPRELEIDFLHNKSIAKLLIDPTVDTDTSLEYLFSGIRTEPLASLFRNELKKLLYIDVRFSNKVVYKFQD